MAHSISRSVFGICGVLLLTLGGSAMSHQRGAQRSDTQAQVARHLHAHPPEHRVPSIDGAQTPELFSDEKALSVFLQMAATSDPRAGRLYLRHIFNRGNGADQAPLSANAIESVRLIAVAYVAELMSGSVPVHSVDRTSLIRGYWSQLESVLQPSGTNRLQTTLRTRVKPKMRKFVRP